MSNTKLIIGTVVAALLIVAYVVLTVTNHDGNTLLGLLGGWLGGLGVEPAVNKANS